MSVNTSVLGGSRSAPVSRLKESRPCKFCLADELLLGEPRVGRGCGQTTPDPPRLKEMHTHLRRVYATMHGRERGSASR